MEDIFVLITLQLCGEKIFFSKYRYNSNLLVYYFVLYFCIGSLGIAMISTRLEYEGLL